MGRGVAKPHNLQVMGLLSHKLVKVRLRVEAACSLIGFYNLVLVDYEKGL